MRVASPVAAQGRELRSHDSEFSDMDWKEIAYVISKDIKSLKPVFKLSAAA